MPEDALGVITARAVGEPSHAGERVGLALVSLHVAHKCLACICPCSWIVQAFLGSGNLLLDTSVHPPPNILLERTHDRPEEAVNRRDVEKAVVADIAPYLANSDLRIGDAGDTLTSAPQCGGASG